MPPIQQQWKRPRWLTGFWIPVRATTSTGTLGAGTSLMGAQDSFSTQCKKSGAELLESRRRPEPRLAWCFLKSTPQGTMMDQGTGLCLWPHLWPYMTLNPTPMDFPVLIVPQGGCLLGGCDIRAPREFTTPEIFKPILLLSSYICKHELQGNISLGCQAKPWHRWLWSPAVVTALLGASSFSKHFCSWLCRPIGEEFRQGEALYPSKLGPLCLSRAQTGFTWSNELIAQTTGRPGCKVVCEAKQIAASTSWLSYPPHP